MNERQAAKGLRITTEKIFSWKVSCAPDRGEMPGGARKKNRVFQEEFGIGPTPGRDAQLDGVTLKTLRRLHGKSGTIQSDAPTPGRVVTFLSTFSRAIREIYDVWLMAI
jgi:hypothetical protein